MNSEQKELHEMMSELEQGKLDSFEQRCSNLFGYHSATQQQSLSLQSYVQVLRQVEECNSHFHSLRTIIRPDPNDILNLFYFVMIPNDGALANKPLVGRMVIPIGYPNAPPVLHLFTKTSRYNVDVFHGASGLSSSMCFDILRESMHHGDGGWLPNYTISCLFASLMMAVVSFLVPQQYGPDKEEAVSMEKLQCVKKNVQLALKEWGKVIPEIPEIAPILGSPCHAIDLFDCSDGINVNNQEMMIVSRAFYLQAFKKRSNNVTVRLDLSNLPKNCVFSVILTNNTGDIFGKKRGTVLVRNGVTGSAAKKLAGKNIKWFYHGIPMNSGSITLQVTVAQNQFTICYVDKETKDNTFKVHGDTPVSFLTPKEIGNVKDVPFYLVIYFKQKGTQLQFTIPVLPTENEGYIFVPESAKEEAQKDNNL